MERSIERYRLLGYDCSEPVYDPIQNVYLALCTMGSAHVELVAPHDQTSPCHKYLKGGPTPYHICYEVDSITQAMEYLREHNIYCKEISPPKEATLMKNACVGFFYIMDMGLVELIEYEKDGT